jgi:hypothetical protein
MSLETLSDCEIKEKKGRNCLFSHTRISRAQMKAILKALRDFQRDCVTLFGTHFDLG